CRVTISVSVLEVAERSVDRSKPVCSTCYGHATQSEMPLVAGVVRVETAYADGARPIAGGVIGHPEVHDLEPTPGCCNRLDIGHAERSLDQNLDTQSTRDSFGCLDLSQQGLDQID